MIRFTASALILCCISLYALAQDATKVPLEREPICAMLRARFGAAVARTIQVDVDARAGKLTVRGEVPDETVRQAVMHELEDRVTRLRMQDFALEVAGPVPMMLNFEARSESERPMLFASDLSVAVSYPRGSIYELATGRRINRMAIDDNSITSMAISSDGKHLATGHRYGQILLWDLPVGRNPREIQPAGEKTSSDSDVIALAFTPDGKGLVSVLKGEGAILLWDLAKGSAKTIGSHKTRENPRQLDARHAVAVSPDGATIASANMNDSFVLMFDVASRTQKAVLDTPRVQPDMLVWSHDGKTLASGRATGDQRGVALWDIATRTQRILSTEQDQLIDAIAFSPDDRTLAVQYNSAGVGLWDLVTGKMWQTIPQAKVGGGKGLGFSSDGAVLAIQCAGLRPSAIRLWDVSGRPGGSGKPAEMPKPLADQPTLDDRLAHDLEEKIRHTFDRRNVEALEVEVLPDGAIKLTGKVQYNENKRVAQLEAETYHDSEYSGPMPRNKVINELQVVGDRSAPVRRNRP